MRVTPKKHLGQHFLHDENIARKIASSIKPAGKYKTVLEIGPGMGVLTKYLLENKEFETWVVEVDRESVAYLEAHYPQLKDQIISWDFLKLDLAARFHEPIGIIGNFPYNISSQILFRVLEFRSMVPEACGMFQKEVAERIASKPGNKTYGILSVLLQAWYDIEYLFTVSEHVFSPPPKVKSAVIRLRRNAVEKLDCDEQFFTEVVKTSFNQRRKTLRNALRIFEIIPGHEQDALFTKRAEQLSVADFVRLTSLVRKR
ncbi:MAG TPA: 16S rRNA (adenine(1518)-N(6)/adenine(1519)-N(6))-dimethyltransferase RsmA [Bacteroidia bacterium]|nr:16S rRNA (adenine(1518)-N(6)/adenine(1519)-N(6))-dimethyltransferase RsmA [Bacteroidia bacterium]